MRDKQSVKEIKHTIEKAHSIELGVLFKKSNKIKIPPNQRPYAWGKDQVLDFLNDLESTRVSKEISHFFNLVTYLSKEDYIEIQDGQQRVTTTYLTFLVYYKIHKSLISKFDNHIASSEKIEEHKIKNNKFKEYIFSRDNSRKLELYGSNNEMLDCIFNTDFVSESKFNKHIDPTDKSFNTASNKKIYEAVKLIQDFPFEKHKKEYKDENNDFVAGALELIEEYLDTLSMRFQIIEAQICDVKDTFRIFELVNSRGIALSEFDKAKNYLYQVVSCEKNSNNIDKITNIIEKLFTTLGDNAEEAFCLHWTMFFNMSDTKSSKYGDPKNIFKSLKHGVEFNERNSRHHQRIERNTKEKINKVFEFVEDLEKNINNIVMFYKIINFNLKDREDFYNLCKEIRVDLETDEVKDVFVYYHLSSNYFEYTKNYFYYLFLCHLNNRIKFNILIEFKKVVAFYVANSIVADRMSHLESLNNSLGKRLADLKSCEIFDLNILFAKFINDEPIAYNSIQLDEIENKMAAEEVDYSSKLIRLIYVFIYNEFEGNKTLFDIFFSWCDKEKKFKIIEQEHVFAKSLSNSVKYEKFNFHDEHSKLRRRMEWLGNKLVINRFDNRDIGEDFSKKITTYIECDDITRKFASIFLGELSGDEAKYSNFENLKKDAPKEIGKLFDQISSANSGEEIGMRIEEKWRKEISKVYKNYDLLGINNIINIKNDFDKHGDDNNA